ncbi:MAG: hypothetical protein M1133_02990 [Armatimonadetes bacterium]|nr:hypothetical protein [Armatimonadota bacterium]
MSEMASGRRDTLASLRSFASLLEERNLALARLSDVGREMRVTLQRDPSADIRAILERRQEECVKFASISRGRNAGEHALLREAERAADGTDGASKATAVWVLELHADAQALADEVMTCQAECEAILKERLKSVSKALRTSAQRRKLDAAYGPAHRHDTPVFLDRQR